MNETQVKEQDLYLVRHYSHVYIAEKTKDDGDRYAYYRLIRIYKEYKPGGVSISSRGTIYVRSNTTNNYVGSIVRKDKNTVYTFPREKYNELLNKDNRFGGLGVFIAVVIMLFIIFVLVAG